jgi:hypothetical protein
MTLPMPDHNRVIMRILLIIARYIEKQPVGELFVPDTPFLLSEPDHSATLRSPDLAFVAAERAARLDPKKRIQRAPEPSRLSRLRTDLPSCWRRWDSTWRPAGSWCGWCIRTSGKCVFEASGAMRILKEGDMPEAPDLRPGFSTPGARFFD